MRVAYLFDIPELGGGVKVALEHAHLLAELGHEVVLLGRGEPPGWFELRLPWKDVSQGPRSVGSFDLVIATYWTTLEHARELELGPLAHYCQGYEAAFSHLAGERTRIEALYGLPIPTFTVTAHLARVLSERHGRPTFVVPPKRDEAFRPRFRWRPRRRPWIAVPGIFEAEVKGVPTALEAVRRLRELGIDGRLLRISTYPLTEEELRRWPADSAIVAAPPGVVARALPRCDLLLFPSRPEEGFGLPVLEAMSAGVPVVASDIPSVREIADGQLVLVPTGDAETMAVAARGLLEDAGAWRRARRRGLVASRRYDRDHIVARLDEGLAWAIRAAREGHGAP